MKKEAIDIFLSLEENSNMSDLNVPPDVKVKRVYVNLTSIVKMTQNVFMKLALVQRTFAKNEIIVYTISEEVRNSLGFFIMRCKNIRVDIAAPPV